VVKHSDMMLSGRPHLPRDHRLVGSGAPKSRRQIRQPIVMVYENRMETVPSELKALKAVYEPVAHAISTCSGMQRLR